MLARSNRTDIKRAATHMKYSPAFLAILAAPMTGTAATITNPSFETDTNYTVSPGYQSANNGGVLTGWTSSNTARTGINASPSLFAGVGPFANNGAIPQGTQAAFVQAVTGTPTSLSTTITGLTAGQTYRVTFNFNSRDRGTNTNLNNANSRPNGTVTVGGNAVNFQVNPVQAAGTLTQPYRTASVVFTASGATETLSMTNTVAGSVGGTAQTDTALVIDNFQISAASTAWKSSAWTSDATSGIIPSLTYTHAYDLGAAGLGASINGVAFTGVAGGSPSVSGAFSTSGWTTALGSDVNQLTLGGGGSGTLATDFLYGGASQTAQTLTLNGLTAGSTYRLSLFGVGWTDAGTTARAVTASDGAGDILTLNEHQFGVDNGIKFEFEYTASGTSKTFTFNPTSTITTMHLYGFANAALVPEPGTAALAGLGTALLLRRRRK